MRNALPASKSPTTPEHPGEDPKEELVFDLLPEPGPVVWDEEEPEGTVFEPESEDEPPGLMDWPLDGDHPDGWTDPIPERTENEPDPQDGSDSWDSES